MRFTSFFINKLKQGSEKSYKQLYSEMNLELCLFANKYINDLDVSFDIVQDVFIGFYEKRNKLDVGSSLENLLYTSVKNQSIDYLRKECRIDSLKDNYSLFSSSIDEYNQLEAEVCTEIHKLLEDLPEQSKQIIILSMNGASNREVAEDLDISFESVKHYKKVSYSIVKNKLKVFFKKKPSY